MTTSKQLSESLFSDNNQELVSLVEGLVAEGTVRSVKVMLACLDDDYDSFHEMAVVMHGIERIDPAVVYESFAQGLPGLSFHALDALNDAHELDAESDSAAEGRRMSR